MHVCIIGGGASGVFAGITIKHLDSTIDVTIIEQNNKLLKKVSKTGSGKCNIMNKNISKEFYNDFSLIEKNMRKVEIDKILTTYGILLYWGGFSQAQIDKLSGQIGRQWDGNLWSLSPEEMKALRSNVDMWTQIQNTGKGGYGGRLTESWMTT